MGFGKGDQRVVRTRHRPHRAALSPRHPCPPSLPGGGAVHRGATRLTFTRGRATASMLRQGPGRESTPPFGHPYQSPSPRLPRPPPPPPPPHHLTEYLVKWRGYSDKSSTWEPRENLVACVGL